MFPRPGQPLSLTLNSGPVVQEGVEESPSGIRNQSVIQNIWYRRANLGTTPTPTPMNLSGADELAGNKGREKGGNGYSAPRGPHE